MLLPSKKSIKFYDFNCHNTIFDNPWFKVSIMERSSDQIVQPINTAALTEWVGTFPETVVMRMSRIATMLEVLGYDPMKNPPNYGLPDNQVINNTKNLKKNKDYWTRRQEKLMKEMRKPMNDIEEEELDYDEDSNEE